VRVAYVYFIAQRYVGSKRVNLKIGHSYNPHSRKYAYSSQQSLVSFLLSIECPNKAEACRLERLYLKIFHEHLSYVDSREWFDLNSETTLLLRSIGVDVTTKADGVFYEKHNL